MYDGNYTGLDTLININGFYENVKGKSAYRENVYYPKIMFYTNGLVCYTTLSSFKKRIHNPIWGSYIIINDTIKSQFIVNNGLMDKIRVITRDFLIVSISELKEICPVHLNDDNYSFHPLENRIDSTNWLLKKKWFWEKNAYEKNRQK